MNGFISENHVCPFNVTNPQMRREFIERAEQFVKTHDFSGVEIDFDVS